MNERERRGSLFIEIENNNITSFKKNFQKNWADIKSHLPPDFDPRYKKFLRSYFRAQLLIANGRKIKAGRIFTGLEKKAGYNEFEEENKSFLAAVDLAVRGETRWDVEPAFRI